MHQVGGERVLELVELCVPGDAALGLFGGELARPAVAVGVLDLVAAERLTVPEQQPVAAAVNSTR
jgi:hypothetical protein